MNIFSQEPSYLVSSDLNTVLGFCSSQPDLTKLEGCNVIAVLPIGTWILFAINPNNETPPNREVNCYYSNFVEQEEQWDVVDVFKFIQSQCIAWTQI